MNSSYSNDYLRNELIKAGLTVSPKIGREQLVRLYDEHFDAPTDSAGKTGAFPQMSSPPKIHITESVRLLSNDALFEQLKRYGKDIGPVVGNTRGLYERMLQRLIDDGARMVDPNFKLGQHDYDAAGDEVETTTTTTRSSVSSETLKFYGDGKSNPMVEESANYYDSPPPVTTTSVRRRNDKSPRNVVDGSAGGRAIGDVYHTARTAESSSAPGNHARWAIVAVLALCLLGLWIYLNMDGENDQAVNIID